MKSSQMTELRITKLIGVAIGLAFYVISTYAQSTVTTTNRWMTGMIPTLTGSLSAIKDSSIQAPSTVTGTGTDNSKTTPAAQFGAFYGGAAGNRDGTLRLTPRPSRNSLYNNQFQYKPAYGSLADYQQQYRSAFERAYRLAYKAALNHQKPQAVSTTQTSGKTAGSN